MDNIKIFLNGSKAKKATNSSITYNVNLSGNRRLFSDDFITSTVSSSDVYNDEREKCNKIRLICEINTVCTNALFNPVTEIVKDEGSYKPTVLNYTPLKNEEILYTGATESNRMDDKNHPLKPITSSNTVDDSSFLWHEYDAVRDTQLSSSDYGFDYHCGLDIFNNHLLRSKTFKIVSFNSDNSLIKYSNGEREKIDNNNNNNNGEHIYTDEQFNTIDDWCRDSMGIRVLNNFLNPASKGKVIYFNVSGKINKSEKKNTKYDAEISLTVSVKGKSFDTSKITGATINLTYYLKDSKGNQCDEKKYSLGIQGGMFKQNGDDHEYTHTFTDDKGYDDEIVDISVSEDVSFKINDLKPNTFNDGSDEYSLVYNPADKIPADTWVCACHLYQSYDIMDFKEATEKKLIENNGWFGFKNISKLPTFDTSSETTYHYHRDKRIDISKPINSEMTSAFIDMYPGRDLYSFTPKYNKFKHRIEKNWDYCITYPSSSTTEGIDFIDSVTGGLKIQMFDEFIKDDDGLAVINIYSISQHGLKAGDYINLYSTSGKSSTLLMSEAVVANVYDKYIFQIYKSTQTISDKWYNISGNPETFTVDIDSASTTFNKAINTDKIYYNGSAKYYVIPDSRKINLDDTVSNLSFKKVVNNIECKYYVRIFTKLPNFKFAEEEINDNSLYSKGSKLIYKYSQEPFDSSINKLSFAKNAYGDAITEIVFTDDIDLSYLKDNLYRPLTSVYLTIVKRNKGYKNWYGIKYKDTNDKDYNLNDVEFSHCFGKNSCAFRLSDDILDDTDYKDVRTIDKNHDGLAMKTLNPKMTSNESDEIDFDECQNFYGDLCCYSPSEVKEDSIQNVMNRFNTAQRELDSADRAYSAFSKIYYDTINNDEASLGYVDPYKAHMKQDGFSHSVKELLNVLPRNEGYYYQPHYKIPVKTISSDLSEAAPLIYKVLNIKYVDSNNNHIEVYTSEDNYFTLNSKPALYDKDTNKVYTCIVNKIITRKKFRCTIYDENGNTTRDMPTFSSPSRFTIAMKDENIPEYAKMLKDGSCKYRWREILQNGSDNNTDIETYPFTNGAFYINRRINFYLRRQDPYEETSINANQANNGINYEPNGESLPDSKQDNNYVSSENMKEC